MNSKTILSVPLLLLGLLPRQFIAADKPNAKPDARSQPAVARLFEQISSEQFLEEAKNYGHKPGPMHNSFEQIIESSLPVEFEFDLDANGSVLRASNAETASIGIKVSGLPCRLRIALADINKLTKPWFEADPSASTDKEAYAGLEGLDEYMRSFLTSANESDRTRALNWVLSSMGLKAAGAQFIDFNAENPYSCTVKRKMNNWDPRDPSYEQEDCLLRFKLDDQEYAINAQGERLRKVTNIANEQESTYVPVNMPAQFSGLSAAKIRAIPAYDYSQQPPEFLQDNDKFTVGLDGLTAAQKDLLTSIWEKVDPYVYKSRDQARIHLDAFGNARVIDRNQFWHIISPQGEETALVLDTDRISYHLFFADRFQPEARPFILAADETKAVKVFNGSHITSKSFFKDYVHALGLDDLVETRMLTFYEPDNFDPFADAGGRIAAILPNNLSVSIVTNGPRTFDTDSIVVHTGEENLRISQADLRDILAEEAVHEERAVLDSTKGGSLFTLAKGSAIYNEDGIYYIASNPKGGQSLYFIDRDSDSEYRLVDSDDKDKWSEDDRALHIRYQLPEDDSYRMFTYDTSEPSKPQVKLLNWNSQIGQFSFGKFLKLFTSDSKKFAFEHHSA